MNTTLNKCLAMICLLAVAVSLTSCVLPPPPPLIGFQGRDCDYGPAYSYSGPGYGYSHHRFHGHHDCW